MLRVTNCCIPLLLCILSFSCSQQKWRSEKEEMDFWNARVVDPAHDVLYKVKSKTPALTCFDSLLQIHGAPTPYTRSARFRLQANYHYFFTPDNGATARMVDSALGVFNTATLQRKYPRTYVSLLIFGGHLAYRLQTYNKANEYFFRAKLLADTHLDACGRSAYNYSIAMVLYKQQNFAQSLNYFKEAYDLQNTCSPQTTAIVLQQQEIQSNIGLCLLQLHRYDSALVHFDKALRIAEQYRDSLGGGSMEKIYGVVYGNKAQAYMAKKKLNLARQLCLKSIALNGRPGYETENAQHVKLQLAEIYGWQQEYPAMAGVLGALRTELDTLPNATVELGWRRLMSAYYEQTGQPKPGLAMYKSFTILGDSLAALQTKLTAADVTRQLEDKELALQITVLKKDKQIATVLMWVTLVVSLMAVVIIVLIYQHYRNNKKSLATSLALNEEINRQKAAREQEAKQRHKAITEAVIQAQEHERSLIRLELHDNINQVLTTVKLHNEMVLDGIGDPKVLLSRAAGYLQDCINEIRSLSKRLSAPTLGKISLEESVNDLLDSVNLTNKVKITREISGVGSKTLKQELHLSIYRILQEQLNNVLKHAGASEVVVKLEGGNEGIRLHVSDNGHGFATDTKKAGIGLMNMRTRAENLNGSFELKSAPGAGCLVEVVIPCR